MKVIVLDDDPTGSQTVHSCPLLLQWDIETLRSGIRVNSPFLFLLVNTRSLSPHLAEKRIREVCKSLFQLFKLEGFSLEEFLFVSRGDSTLRGHGILEPEVISEELGPFDATLHAPAFFEGGRTTVNGIHMLNGIPVHKTPFAKDRIFGYSTSQLDKWIEEKSGGRIIANSVEKIPMNLLTSAIKTSDGFDRLVQILSDFSGNISVIVDAKYLSHFEVLGKAVRLLHGRKRFLFRSAASLLNGLAPLYPNPIKGSEFSSLRLCDQFGKSKPGLVVVGSHVELADQQLEVLLQHDQCIGVEIPVKKIVSLYQGGFPDISLRDLEKLLSEELDSIMTTNKTPVLYTSRGEIEFNSAKERLSFGVELAELIARIVRKLEAKLGYIISKGGITTQFILLKGFELSQVNLQGQILPGLSVVCPEKKNRGEELPIITFPGNLGDKYTLLNTWKIMES